LPGQAGRKLTWLGHLYAVTGERAEAEAILARVDSLAGNEFIQPTDRTALALALGDRDRALELIEQAERDRNIEPVVLQLDERLDPCDRSHDTAGSSSEWGFRRVGFPIRSRQIAQPALACVRFGSAARREGLQMIAPTTAL
jgi:hypothetical protein